jgi:hypothetical protein
MGNGKPARDYLAIADIEKGIEDTAGELLGRGAAVCDVARALICCAANMVIRAKGHRAAAAQIAEALGVVRGGRGMLALRTLADTRPEGRA